MGIKSVAKRARFGEQLIALETEGVDAIDRLRGLTQTLPALKQAITSDEDLDAAEKQDALAEVDAVIVSLVTQVKEFAGGL